MPSKTQDITTGIDRSMRTLRQAMRGIQIRTAGFRRDHDQLARAVSQLTLTLLDAEALLSASGKNRRRR